MRADRPRGGSALIEVLIALVLLAVSGTALVTLLGQTQRSIVTLRETERQTRDAAAELSALSVLGRSDLAARVGWTTAHGWSLRIDRLAADLFDVGIATSDTGAVLLRTALYRPDTADAPKP